MASDMETDDFASKMKRALREKEDAEEARIFLCVCVCVCACASRARAIIISLT